MNKKAPPTTAHKRLKMINRVETKQNLQMIRNIYHILTHGNFRDHSAAFASLSIQSLSSHAYLFTMLPNEANNDNPTK